jgi:hypothetical protein
MRKEMARVMLFVQVPCGLTANLLAKNYVHANPLQQAFAFGLRGLKNRMCALRFGQFLPVDST